MYNHILIATDGSELANRGMAHGLSLAQKVGARVTIVTVTEMWTVMGIMRDRHAGTSMGGEPNPIVEYEATETAHADLILKNASQQAASKGVACEVVHVADRHPADGIVTTAAEKGCDLIVMASHGRRGMGRLLLGSQANEVVTHSKVPTLIVK